MPKLLLVQVMRKGWQAVRQALVAVSWALVLVCFLLFSVDSAFTVLLLAIEAVLDQLLGEGQGAVYVEFILYAIIALIGFWLFNYIGSSSDSSAPLSTRLARMIWSRCPAFEAFRAYRAIRPESASIMEALLASMLASAGIVTLVARGIIVDLINSPFPTGFPRLVQFVGSILDLAIVLYLTTVLFRRHELKNRPELKPTLADNVPIVMYVDRGIFRELVLPMLGMVGLYITVPALEVLLTLWLF